MPRFQWAFKVISTSLFVLCATAGIPAIASASATTTASAPAAAATTTSPIIDAHSSADVEAAVQAYFADVPTMVAVADCESGFRQYGPNGNVLFDPTDTMIGVFQISSIHLPQAFGFGMDITTLEGNLAYAKYLYEQQGLEPWMSSYNCWHHATVTAAPEAPASASSAQGVTTQVSLAFGMVSPQVLTLQQMLNRAGFELAASGPGSPGQETTTFGFLTRDAVRRFQCAKNIVCSGDEATTGYGAVDARTYTALLAAANPPAAATAKANPTPSSAVAQASSSTLSAATAAASSALTAAAGGADNAAQIAQVESQITALVNQLDVLDEKLANLTR
ncbi:MAG: peptidoglycan-binding domain-containing protein [Minisyncoccia bacterium]